jgi:hypothetical protein
MDMHELTLCSQPPVLLTVSGRSFALHLETRTFATRMVELTGWMRRRAPHDTVVVTYGQ